MYVTAWLEFFLNHRINAERKAIMIWRALSLVLAFSWLHCSHLHCTDWLNTDVCVCACHDTQQSYCQVKNRWDMGWQSTALRDCSCPVLLSLWLHFSFSSFQHWPDTPVQSARQATGNSPRAPDSQCKPECVSPSIIYFYYFYYFSTLTAFLFYFLFLKNVLSNF